MADPSRLNNVLDWDRGWFRQMTPNQKVIYFYIQAFCDHAGFWCIDIDLLALRTGLSKKMALKTLLSFPGDVLSIGAENWSGWVWLIRHIETQGNLPLDVKVPFRVNILSLLEERKSMDERILLYLQGKPISEGLRGSETHLGGPYNKEERISNIAKHISKGKGGIVKGGKTNEPKSFFEDILPENFKSNQTFLASWRLWVRYRNETKHPLTQSMAESQVKKLVRDGLALSTYRLDRSIRNGWRGLWFPNERDPEITRLQRVEQEAAERSSVADVREAFRRKATG